MRVPMASALCIAFVSVAFPHPGAAQVNSRNLQSFQAQHPKTTQQSAPGLRANFADQQANRPCCNLLTAPLPNRPASVGWPSVKAANPCFTTNLPLWREGWLMQQPSEAAAIESTLTALKHEGASQSRLSEQLADAMMALTDKDHRPPWSLIAIFADTLTRELRGKQLTTGMRECLSEAMRPTGTSNARLATRLQELLAEAGLKPWKTQLIIDEFIKLRESVQGPDDIPVRLTIPIPH